MLMNAIAYYNRRSANRGVTRALANEGKCGSVSMNGMREIATVSKKKKKKKKKKSARHAATKRTGVVELTTQARVKVV